LLQRLASIQLVHGTDEFRWCLTKNNIFSVNSIYKALTILSQPIVNNKPIWKMKIPLKTKTKIFAWYLRRGVILTKNNATGRNVRNVIFCHENEIIKYLFFNCRVARSTWPLIQIRSTLYPPRSIANIFGNWLNEVDPRYKTLIRVGRIGVVWSLLLYRNDKVFNDKNSSLVQVIYRCTALLRSWSPLQRLEDRDLFTKVSTGLENTAKELIS
jgi:hypothetical protein